MLYLCGQTSPVTVSVPGSSREYYTDGFYPDYVYALAANQDAHTSGLQNEWVRVCRYNAGKLTRKALSGIKCVF